MRRRIEGHASVQPKNAIGDQDGAAVRGRVRRLERCRVICRAVPNGTVVAHVDCRHDIAEKHRRDVIDLDIVHPDDPAILADQVDAEMAVIRRRPPNHVNAGPVADADNRAHFDNFAIAGQRHGIADRAHTRHCASVRPRCIGGNSDAGKIAADRLDPHLDLQIAARNDRCLAFIAQALRVLCFLNLERTAEILIRRHIGAASGCGIAWRARRAIPARVYVQPLRIGGRGECDAVGDRLVHIISLCASPAQVPEQDWEISTCG